MKKALLLQSLEKIGLSPRESRVYLAAVELGECGMSDLAEKAGLQRTGTYPVVESLESRGLLGTFKTKSGTRFIAKDPKHLLEEVNRHASELERVLPVLVSLRKGNPSKPTVTYYEGVDAYMRAVEGCLSKNHSTIRHIGSLAEGHQVLSEDYDFKYFAPERVKRNIYLKSLYTPDVAHKFPPVVDDKMLREIRFLPEGFPMRTLTLIYGSTVVISTTHKTLVTVVIESEEIAEAERSKFDLLWNATKKAA